ncbi:Uncharacterized protein ALO91_05081 [Pseudomonas syringae pv. aceris]|uniref:DUF4145 domain-containing protein n=2 Tax=Pseudomonas syringae TaxID=317 RepID=A0A0P9GWP9_PSESX|nr:Uncharacterized protein ALO91_05081 [Pseudomonas syringae pv. aceris]
MSSAHCNRCASWTMHDEVRQYAVSEANTDRDPWEEWGTIYRIWSCRGCQSILFKIEHWHSDYDMSAETEYFPPRISRKSPPWMSKLPDDWQSLLQEVYRALHTDSRRLAIMGVRALIDIYINATIGDVGGFAKKLAALVRCGHLSSVDQEILEVALDAGHAAAHRGYVLQSADVTLVMDIVENLLHRHSLRASAAELGKSIPSRPKRN